MIRMLRSFIVIFVLAPVPSGAAYLIKLKNGNEILTARYWHQGEQVMFDAFGGVFGVDRSLVARVEASDRTVKTEFLVAHQPAEPLEKDPGLKKEPEKKQPEHKEQSGPAENRKADDPILREFQALKEDSTRLDGMLTSEIVDYSNRLTEFKRKLQREGKTNEYLREFGEIHEMGNAVEAALKSRH